MPIDMSFVPAEFQAFLDKRQFTVQEILQAGRYLVLKGTMPEYESLLLLKAEGAGGKVSLLHNNYIAWTQSVSRQVPADAPFRVVPILDDGLEGQWHWFVSPFIEGTPFATIENAITSQIAVEQPQELLSKIIALMRFIDETPARSVAGIDGRAGKISTPTRSELIDSAIGLARNDTPYLADLLQIIKSNSDHLETASAHGDFSEINLIIDEKHRPVLIDAELSSAYHYRYYDAAEFYNRLMTRANEPELAKTFFSEYLRTVPEASRQSFLSNFLCLSASRALGNFVEIAGLEPGPLKDRRRNWATEYVKNIVTHAIIRNE